VAVALVVVGTVLASSLLDLLQATVDSSTVIDPTRLSAALRPLELGIPAVLSGLVLLLVTTKSERLVSLTQRNGEP
jgi:hypothetical protein